MTQIYGKQNPFLASIKDRYSLSGPGSKKNTQHIVLDLGDSGLNYEVGDSVGVYPVHDRDLVDKILNAMKVTGQELVNLKQSDEQISFSEFLTSKANLNDISPKLFREVCNRQSDPKKKHFLKTFLQEDRRDDFKNYVGEHEIWDFLSAHEEVTFSPAELTGLMMPLLPRFYSISSSQKCVGNEVHLTVNHLEYESGGHKRHGVCTHYLFRLVELNNPVVPIFIQPTHAFKLPDDVDAHMIMIGPGTGIAPFRAFMQERILHYGSKAKHWLFFGERNRAHDFYYEEDWSHLSGKGDLQLALAFSRDQDHKVYVQHKIREHGEEIYRWLEEGAYFYVCGDAQNMAKDVEIALQAVIQEYGKKDVAETKEYMKRLRQQKRYLRDVY